MTTATCCSIGTARILRATACMHLSVCLSQHRPTAANPLLQFAAVGPGGQDIWICCRIIGTRRANVGSTTLSAYVGSCTAPAASNRYLLIAGRSAAANLPAAVAAVDRRNGQTDGRTDTRPLHRSCCACYEGGGIGKSTTQESEWLMALSGAVCLSVASIDPTSARLVVCTVRSGRVACTTPPPPLLLLLLLLLLLDAGCCSTDDARIVLISAVSPRETQTHLSRVRFDRI